jgi:thiol-disulfide isomerase/thioredoxin
MDLSGHERDKLFLSRAGHDVVDVSYLSGADGIEDARTFAKADLDRDGYEDLIVVNRNAPLLRIYHNQLGPATKHHFVGVRVEGARQRDAVGARLTARGCGTTQTREIAIGTGFATQNAMAVTLGLGTCAQIDELTVKFPNGGERRTFKNVAADAFYRVVEGKGIQTVPNVYGHAATPAVRALATDPNAPFVKLAARAPGHAPLVAIDVFASWCEACVRTAPRLDAVTSALVGRLDVVSVSIEPTDDDAALAKFRGAHPWSHPLVPYDEPLATAIADLFAGAPPLPSTVIVDRKTGAIVFQTRGVPTRSELERSIWATTPRP